MDLLRTHHCHDPCHKYWPLNSKWHLDINQDTVNINNRHQTHLLRDNNKIIFKKKKWVKGERTIHVHTLHPISQHIR